MNNLDIYNRFRAVPAEAQKTIKGGKLNGFTDINPMWRIKMLTEGFGPCGFGWYIESEEHWTEQIGNEVGIFCRVALKVKHPENGEWSMPIVGIGGSKLVGKGKGYGMDDEAYKMAFTDAISVACKNLGMAADVYYANDRTKYTPAPKAKAPMSKEHPKWQDLLNAVLAGQFTWQRLEEMYAFNEADLAEGKEWVLNQMA